VKRTTQADTRFMARGWCAPKLRLMNSNSLLSTSSLLWYFALFASGLLAPAGAAAAATTNVLVGDIYFYPPAVQINPGDIVQWDWVGFLYHTTTSLSTPVPLWDSGVHTNGYTFSHSFPSAGNFPYWCSVHALQQTGTVIVSTNSPPTVAIISPTNGSVFAAPWAGTIQATNSDISGTVSEVAFFAGSALLGTVTNPPSNVRFPVPSLAAGSYLLKAVAVDNHEATNSSVLVRVNVIAPTPIALSSPQWRSPTTFQFTYSANPGLTYIVRRAEVLSDWSNIANKKAAMSSITFIDAHATIPAKFYSVELMPNF
jgi:plastocyanin